MGSSQSQRPEYHNSQPEMVNNFIQNDQSHRETFKWKIKKELPFLTNSEIDAYLNNYQGRITVYGLDLEEEKYKILQYFNKEQQKYQLLLNSLKSSDIQQTQKYEEKKQIQQNDRNNDIQDNLTKQVKSKKRQIPEVLLTEELNLQFKNSENIQKLEKYLLQEQVINQNDAARESLYSVFGKMKELMRNIENQQQPHLSINEQVIIFHKIDDFDSQFKRSSERHKRLLKSMGYFFKDVLGFYISDQNLDIVVFSIKAENNEEKLKFYELIDLFIKYIRAKKP